MHINYIILAHTNPAQVERLINKLSTATTSFYIHIDKHVAIDPFTQQLATTKNSYFVEPREKGTWGDLGIVKATLHALRQLVADQRSGYCVLLSGQDYPIKSNEQIMQFLTRNQGASFIEAFALPRIEWDNGGLERIEQYKFDLSDKRGDHVTVPSLLSKEFSGNWVQHVNNIKRLLQHKISPWIILKKRRFPHYIQPCGGSQWWAIPLEMAQQVLAFLDRHPDYLVYHQHTLLPDEIALQSIVSHVLHTEVDGIIQPPVLYANWERPNVSLPVTFDKNDIQELLAQPEGKLFARKLDAETDAVILDLLDNHLKES